MSRLLETEWVEQRLGSSSVVLSVPWPLERRTPERPPEVVALLEEDVSLWREADGITIIVTYMRLVPGRSLDESYLDIGADEMLANLRSGQGVISVEGSKSEQSILGTRAIDVDAVMKHHDGLRHQVHAITWIEGSETWLLMLTHPSDQPDGEIVWAKLRNGIRRTAA